MLFSFWDILFIVRWSDTTEIMCEDLPRISNIIFIITLYLIVLSPLQTSVRRIIWFYVIACIFIMLTLQTGNIFTCYIKVVCFWFQSPAFLRCDIRVSTQWRYFVFEYSFLYLPVLLLLTSLAWNRKKR